MLLITNDIYNKALHFQIVKQYRKIKCISFGQRLKEKKTRERKDWPCVDVRLSQTSANVSALPGTKTLFGR